MYSDKTLAIHLQELEESLLQSAVRKSELVSELLSEEFVEFGSSGRSFTKEQIITSLHAEPPVKCTATEFNIKLLAPQTALVTYRAVAIVSRPCSQYAALSGSKGTGSGKWSFTKVLFRPRTNENNL
jgi:hypothetical protein